MKSDHRGIGMTSQRTRERLVRRLQEQGISNQAVLDVIRKTPRHIFMDEALATRAYEDIALPIGYGQTISQPYIVARMTEALIEADEQDESKEQTSKLKKVLEVGTGSGYQAAIIAQLVESVYTVERIQPLMLSARRRFQELNLWNIHINYGDGNIGWEDQAPFDGILVTAAPESIPESLLHQLTIGGRLVIPLGGQGGQELLRITRTTDGYEKEVLNHVSFVPMLAGKE